MSKKKSKEPLKPDEVTEILNVSVLHDMIKTLEETKLKLLLNIKELKEKLAQQKEDQADIYYYLNKKCDESFETIASLEEQIINEQTDREISEKLYESRLEEARATIASNELKYTSKISELETKLEMLNSYTEEKQEMETRIKELMTQLEEERLQFKLNAESIENKFLMERDKLRKSYDIKYEAIKRELEVSVENKLSKKTKKTQIMNVVMKKELDNQSKHAEKLLEVNEAIIERDRTLKLELELAKSLQEDVTKRLTMVQRTNRQLQEKIVQLENEKQAAADEHACQLTSNVSSSLLKSSTALIYFFWSIMTSLQAETIINLEAQISKLNKQKAVENAKLDEMWHFLAQSYQLLKSRNGGGTPFSLSSAVKGGSEVNGGGKKVTQSAALMYDHEKMLVDLVKSVATKYPKVLSGTIAAQLQTSSVASADNVGSVEADMSQLSSVTRNFVVSNKAQPSESSCGSSATGIPSWDMKTAIGDHYQINERSIRVRSVHVQTEAKLAPYPPGSTWLGSPARRSMQLYDGDNSSIGQHSVNTWWDGASHHSQTSMDDDAYSAKTLSHLTAPRRDHSRSHKITKLKKQLPKSSQSPNEKFGGGGMIPPELLSSIEGKPIAKQNQSQQPMDIPGVPTSWSVGTATPVTELSSHAMQKSPIIPPMAYRQSHSNFSARPGNFLHNFLQQQHFQSSHQQQGNISPGISVSGHGFVAPTVLPKL